MKQLPAIILLITLAAFQINSHAQTLAKNNISTQPIEAKSDKQMLSELNAQFIRNFLMQDTVAHNKIIHKDFVCIESSGKIVTRDEYMKKWATDFDNSGYKSFSYTDEFIRIFGDMALVRSKTIYTKEVNGKAIQGYTIYTDTYVKENGTWLCVQAQITPVKSAQ